jgi:predicted dehydrogenase
VRLLILSNRPAPARERALVALAGAAGEATLLPGGEALPELDGFDAVVVDGPAAARPAGELAALEAAVQRGVSLVATAPAIDGDGFWPALLGARTAGLQPEGEYFGRVAGADPDGLATRVDPEFAVVDGFRPLVPTDAGVVVAVSIGFQDRPAVTVARRGQGRVVTTALGAGDAALGVPALQTILRRALQPLHRRAAAPARPIGVAIVGYGPFGGMGYYHGLGIAATPGLELVAVVDPSDERRKAAGDDFPGAAGYTSVDDLAADDAVDLAIVATPPSAHFGLTRQLLRAGKHVACEKPLCLTAAEADELIATAAGHDRVLTVHQNRRWDPDFLAVRRAVDAGLLGDLFNVETFVGGFEHPCRAWHSDVEVSGGAVYDWGSHHVDWILQLLGSAPERVTTFGHKRVWHDVTNLDQLRLHLAWDDGREAEFFQSDVAAVRRPKFFVQGTAGTLVGHYRPMTIESIEPGRGYVADRPHHAEAPADLTLARYESGYGLTSTSLPVAPEQRFAFHRNLADHLHLGEPLAVTAASVRSVVAVLEASQRSSDEGGRVVEL